MIQFEWFQIDQVSCHETHIVFLQETRVKQKTGAIQEENGLERCSVLELLQRGLPLV